MERQTYTTVQIGLRARPGVTRLRSITYPRNPLLPGTRSSLEKYVTERCFGCARPISECECPEAA